MKVDIGFALDINLSTLCFHETSAEMGISCGKVENGESKEDCLGREIREELGLTIEVGTTLTVVEHHYPEFSLHLYPFLCKWTVGSLAIVEHAQAIWVEKNELQDYDWAEADLPIVREISEL